MRYAAVALSFTIACFAASVSGASAQSIVDLSRPQPGKSRFVFNADLTPADLGSAEVEKPAPVAAVSRVPACGEGCKMVQPELPRESYSYRDEPGSYRAGNGTRVIVISNVHGNQPQQAAKPAPAPRKTFRFRRR